MSIRNRRVATTVASLLIACVAVALPARTAEADPVDHICAAIGVGTGVAGATKALAKGANLVGLGVTVGCWGYTTAKDVTPAQTERAMRNSYKKYSKMSVLERLDALGYLCRKRSSGGGGTDRIAMAAGVTTIKIKGTKYDCRAIRD